MNTTEKDTQQDRGMAIDIAEGTFAAIAVFRHNGKVEAAHVAGRLDDLDQSFVDKAVASLLNSLRQKAEAAGATAPKTIN